MKLTEIRPLDKEDHRPDRLTQLLVAVATILVAAAVAVGIDLWIWPPSGGALAQRGEPTPPIPIPTALLAPTQSPTVLVVRALTAADLPKFETMESAPGTPPPCVPPDDWGIHIVQEGSTLQSLAQRNGIDVETLMRVNCLNTQTIFVGQRLYMPGSPTFPTLVALAATHSLSPTPTSARPLATLPVTGMLVTETPTPSVTSTSWSVAPATPVLEEPVVRTPTPAAAISVAPTETATLDASATPVAAGMGQPGADESGVVSRASAPVTTAYPTASATPIPTATPKKSFQVKIPDRYINIILLGSDKRPKSAAWRTDTMIIVSVDVEAKAVRLLSIPRDLWVFIPGYGYNRINTAELWGELAKRGSGIERVKQTVHYNLGIPIHYYARVDFQGFIRIIDTVGGVDVDVEQPLPDIKLEAGIHHMNGQQALRYARSRKSTSDFDRGRRQRKLLLALWEQRLTMDIIPQLPELWVTMADSFETDLPLDQVIRLAYIGVQLKSQHIISQAIGRKQVKSWRTPQGAAVLLPREDRIRVMLESFYALTDPTRSGTADQVRVEVLNGAGCYQAEQLAAAALRQRGFRVLSTGQADLQDYAQTQIRVHNGALAFGEEVAKELGVPLTAVQDLTTSGEEAHPSNPIDIRVILGTDYGSCQS